MNSNQMVPVFFQDANGEVSTYCNAASDGAAELIADQKNDELDERGLPGFYFTEEGR